MSEAKGPQRRRIAGEGAPSVTPAKKPALGRPTAKKPVVAKKSPVAAPVSPKAPTVSKKKAGSAPVPPRTDTASTGPVGSARPPLWVILASVVAAASVLVGLVMVGSALWGGSGKASDADTRAITGAASSASETIFSFRYDNLEEHIKESKTLMTPAFAKKFDEIAPSLTELAPQRKVQTKAVTRDVAVVECGDECADDKATALVFLDQVRLLGDEKEPTVFANRIKVTLKKVKGEWLVDDIRAV